MKADKHLNDSLLLAAYSDNKIDIEKLVLQGADVNSKDDEGLTPLHLSSCFGNTETLLFLISKGANIHAQDNNGKTVLDSAILYGCKETSFALITKGVDINKKNTLGNTPLHIVSFHGYEEIALELILKGVDVDAKNNSGNTPFFCSGHDRNLEIALTLISYGADSSGPHENFKDLKNLTMHQAAAQGGFTSRMIELLSDFASSHLQDAPEALAALAKQHEKHDTAAAIQSFIAAQAIESMMKETSLAKGLAKS